MPNALHWKRLGILWRAITLGDVSVWGIYFDFDFSNHEQFSFDTINIFHKLISCLDIYVDYFHIVYLLIISIYNLTNAYAILRTTDFGYQRNSRRLYLRRMLH